MLKALSFISEKFNQRGKDTAEDLQKRLDELSILNKMSIALSSGQDLYHLLHVLLEELKKLFVMDEFYIGIYNPETMMVNFPIHFKNSQLVDVNPRNLHEEPGLTGAVIFSEKTLYIPDQADPEVTQRYKPFKTGQRLTRSYIGIPLRLNNTVIGILSVQSEQPDAYTPQQIQLLETIAAQSSMAIEKARLFSELQNELEERKNLIAELETKNAESETLHQSLASIVGTFEFSEIIQRVLDQIKHVVPYDTASVWRVEGNRQKLISGRDLPPEVLDPDFEIIFEEPNSAIPIVKGEVPYILYNNVQEERPDFSEPPHYYINSWLALPLKIRGTISGIICLDGRNKNQFNIHHAELGLTFANQVAVALENAQLFSKLQSELAERERSEQALRESESKLRTIIENVPFDMWLSDKDNRYILQSGESYRLAGDIIGRTPDEIGISPEIVASWKMDYQRAMHGETVYKDTTWEVKGESRNFITTLAPVKDKGAIIGYVGINLDITERKSAEESLRQREAILEAIAFAAEQFFKTTNWRININIVLEHLGKVIDCTHVYIFENFLEQENQPTCHLTYEWTAPGYRSDLGEEKYQNLLLREDGFDYWYEMLSNGEPFVSSSPSLPNDEREHLKIRGIKALVDVPIHVNDKWWGIIGFDDMVKEREWSAAELDALKVASDVFGAAIQRQQVEEKIHQINSELEQRVEQRTTQLQEANQNLNQEKVRLEQYTRQREIMAAMTDLLQASLTMEEASNIVSTHLKLLFPNRDGALYLTASPNNFEPVAIWGEKKSLDVIYTINDCWALRRGKPYYFGSGLPNPPCAHIDSEVPHHALCIPISAQGEGLGNLHISTQNNQDKELISDEEQRFIETIADSVALAIANLRLRERLHFESIRDGLTGLYNRRYLDETLPREIHRAERSNRPISVLMFDIDHFKKFNDTFGHDAGDVVLKNIAGLILSGVRESDIACRYGGEEFVIIFPDTPIDIAIRRAENLLKEASANELHHDGKNLGRITISIGVATYPQHGSTRDKLIKSADEAAYQAKEGGRNRVVVSK